MQPIAEFVPVVEKSTTFKKYAVAWPKAQNKLSRKENKKQFTRHIRVLINPGRDIDKRHRQSDN